MAMICRTAAQCGPWTFLCLRLSGTALVAIGGVRRKNSPQVRLAEDQHLGHALARDIHGRMLPCEIR